MGSTEPPEAPDDLDEAERAFEARLAARLDEVVTIDGDPDDYFLSWTEVKEKFRLADEPQAEPGQPRG